MANQPEKKNVIGRLKSFLGSLFSRSQKVDPPATAVSEEPDEQPVVDPGIPQDKPQSLPSEIRINSRGQTDGPIDVPTDPVPSPRRITPTPQKPNTKIGSNNRNRNISRLFGGKSKKTTRPNQNKRRGRRG